MAVTETRVAAEGQLRIAYIASGVPATAAGGAFATASATPTALLAFCEQVRLDFVPSEYTWIRDRGVLSYAKRTNDGGPYTCEARLAAVATGSLLRMTATAAGASMPRFHLQYRVDTPEHSGTAASGIYHQFHHCLLRGLTFEEGDPSVYMLRAEAQTARWASYPKGVWGQTTQGPAGGNFRWNETVWG